MVDHELSLEAFAAIAASARVRIETRDLEIMREGYLGLQKMLSSLPAAPDPFDEPALIFVPSRSDIP